MKIPRDENDVYDPSARVIKIVEASSQLGDASFLLGNASNLTLKYSNIFR